MICFYKMFKSVRRAVAQGVEKTWHTFASGGEGRGDNEWDGETNRYKMEIMMAGKDLQSSGDPEVICGAIRRIGHLAYTGGPDAAKCSATYLDTLIAYLGDRETHITVRRQIMRSLSEIYRGHRDHGERFRKMDVMSMVAEIVARYSDPTLLRWSCYTLYTMCAGSLHNISLLDSLDLRQHLRILASHSWKGWPRNYAQGLLLMLGYAKEGDSDGLGAEEQHHSSSNSGHPMPFKNIFSKMR